MAKNKKPTKKYVPKTIKAPITKAVFDDLGRDMHLYIMSLSNEPSATAWKKVAKVIMTVSFATDGCARTDKADKVAIDSAVLTLKALSDFNVRSGQWHVSEMDRISLIRGAVAVDRVLPLMDYHQLRRGYIAFAKLIQLVKSEGG